MLLWSKIRSYMMRNIKVESCRKFMIDLLFGEKWFLKIEFGDFKEGWGFFEKMALP